MQWCSFTLMVQKSRSKSSHMEILKVQLLFFRTSNTTRKRITTVAFMYNPKQAVNIITLEQGGELEVKVLDVSLVIVDK